MPAARIARRRQKRRVQEFLCPFSSSAPRAITRLYQYSVILRCAPKARLEGCTARAVAPAKSGLPDFGLSSVQVGYSRLGWLASLAPQGDGIDDCRGAGRGDTPCRQITLGVAARCRVLGKNCSRPRATKRARAT